MKKISIATLAIALVLLSGCNKDNELSNSIDIELGNTTEMQLIKLGGSTGASSVKTRAAIESLDEMRADDRMGIFCLAGRKTDVKSAQTAALPNWGNAVLPPDDPNYAKSTNGRYWSNVCCGVEYDGEDGKFRISPVAGQDYYRYYPITSLYGYDFYGYYPYQAEGVVYDEKYVTVDIAIDGDDDVIYGKSEQIDTCTWFKEYAGTALGNTLAQSYYSARFFRKHPLMYDDAHMKFEHKLARFRFFVYPGPDKEFADSITYDGAQNLCVNGIKLCQQPTNLRLTVAHKTDATRNGALAKANEKLSDFSIRHKGGAPLSDAPVAIVTKKVAGVVVPDTVQVGDCIMFLPGGNSHIMALDLIDKNTGEIYPSEVNTTISFKESTGKKFEAGKTYNVYLQVSGIKDVTITAELADWEESGEDMDLIEFN